MNLQSSTSSIRPLLLFMCCCVISLLSGCSEDNPTGASQGDDLKEGDPGDLEIYIPEEFSGMDLTDSSSRWSFNRSRESEHFIVFWEDGYGDEDPGAHSVPDAYRVDIDDLLEKAELFYDQNIHDLNFAVTGEGVSNLDTYKLMIFLHHQEEWMAAGAGFDDVIGALWVSPGAAQPVGSVIAHEIGHSFQYQVYSDLGGGTGFRYGFGGNGGNAFWEQTANWQARYAYPNEIFNSHDFEVYTENYHKHLHHEDYRYASYFIHYYWTEKHGLDIIGRIWREALEPEDPIEAYMRLTGISTEEMNDEMYDAASKLAMWDLEELRERGRDYIGSHSYSSTLLDDGAHRVDPDHAPQTTGYNVIPLTVSQDEQTVSVKFEGIANAEGFNQVDETIAGWRYGFVALLESGERVYGEMHRDEKATVQFDLPKSTDQLWFVVTGAPAEYSSHAWDDDNSNDDQWPYTVKFTNTTVEGYTEIPEGETPEDTKLTYEISFPVDNDDYSGGDVIVDPTDLANAFKMQPGDISSAIGDEIQFFAVESSGNLNSNTTANGFGHWFDTNGNVTEWGEDARIFSEFNENEFEFSVGQYPGASSPGDSYTIIQALVYEYEPGNTAQLTFEIEVSVE